MAEPVDTRWILQGLWYHPSPTNYFAVAITRTPIYLWAQPGSKEPTRLKTATDHRGEPSYQYYEYAFQPLTTIYQHEEGDTYVHTFKIPPAIADAAAYLRLDGTVQGVGARSRTPAILVPPPGTQTYSYAAPAIQQRDIEYNSPGTFPYPAIAYSVDSSRLFPAYTPRRMCVQFNMAWHTDTKLTSPHFLVMHHLANALGGQDSINRIHLLQTQWKESTVGWNSPWVNPGGDFDPNDYIDFKAIRTETYNWRVLHPKIKEWIPQLGAFGIIIKAPLEGPFQDHLRYQWASRYHPGPLFQPVLLLTFERPTA